MSPVNDDRERAQQELHEACAELTRRLRAGEACRAAHLLPSYPALAAHEDCVVELLYTEFVVCEQLGQHPSLEELRQEFPQYWERLQRVILFGDLFAEAGQDGTPTMMKPTSWHSFESTVPTDETTNGWADHYELLERIGGGGMGIVYRARQVGLNRIVALKMMRGGHGASPQDWKRFRDEAENMARLRHPHIVQIYAVGERAGLPYFAMEYLEGGSLYDRTRRQPQPAREAARSIETVARAVHYAHQNDIIHRDLKPGNILLDADGALKVCDFGLAKRLDGATQTKSGGMMGTPGYAPPEQLSGLSAAVGPASDVYGLGAVLYDLLTGRPPFVGNTPEETAEKAKHQEPVPLRSLSPQVDRELEAVCLKCLEKRPQDRYRSAEALADDLGRWLEGKATVARPRGWPERVWRGVRRQRKVALVLLVIVLMVISWLTGKYVRSPYRQLERHEHELGKGNPVTLIGETGLPGWYKWQTSEAGGRIMLSGDQTVSVQADQLGLVKLLPDPKVSRYRIRAQVRHDEYYEPGSAVGLYFAYGTGDVPEAQEVHLFCALLFNDLTRIAENIGEPYLGNPACLTVQSHILPVRFPTIGERRQVSWIHFQPARPRSKRVTEEMPFPESAPWRDLCVSVTPELIQASFDGLALPAYSREKLDVILPRVTKHVRDGSWKADPRGGLGLYVERGSASFRNVVVEPVGETTDRNY
jgi:eukaryotic-like serine/threonine-protein kinase